MKRKPSDLEANRHYHDRVAGRYDDIYKGPRWDAWYEISWDGLKAHLPRDLRAPVIDLGCGTGRFGLRLAKSGYGVTFSDLSIKMLERSRKKAAEMGVFDHCRFEQADVAELDAFEANHYALAVAQGDVISFASSPTKALKGIRRLLRPGGVLVASVDQTWAALDHYCEKPDLPGLQELLKTGDMEWLARDPRERFPVHTYAPEDLAATLHKTGFEMIDLFGKTVLPMKKLESLFDQPETVRKVLALEKKLCRRPSAMGRASHLQFAARVPEK